jgi:hypothetical protein
MRATAASNVPEMVDLTNTEQKRKCTDGVKFKVMQHS